MDFPARPATATEAPEGLAEALGAEPLWTGVGGNNDLLVELADADTIRSLDPDPTAIRALPVRMVIATAPGDGEYDTVSRCFAPGMGVPEDPVTGSAHTVIAPFWAERLDRTEFLAHQASRRGGDLHLRLTADRVLIGGDAVTVATGNLNL